MLLAALKQHGFKIVQMKAVSELKTLPEFDAAIEQNVKGLGVAGAERPTSSVVRTVASDQPSKLGGETAVPAAAAPVPSTGGVVGANPGMPVENRAVVAQPDTPATPPRKWFWQN